MYTSISAKLSNDQKKKLSMGERIKLSHASLSESGDQIWLTTMQSKKVMKAKSLGKGCMVQMSGKQIQHHIQHGGSLFSWLKGAARDVGNKAVENILPKVLDKGSEFVSSHAEKAVKKGLDNVSKRIQDRIHHKINGDGLFGSLGLGSFGDALDGVGNTALNLGSQLAVPMLTKKFLGGAVKKPRKPRMRKGDGLFDWAGPLAGPLNGIGNLGVDLASKVAVPLATKLLVGGAVKRGRGRPRKSGDGLYL